MEKILEKSLKDARKEGSLTMGAKQVHGSLGAAKLVVMSRSADGSAAASQIESDAEAKNIPMVHYDGTSVALGRACGLQFRTSAVAFTSLAETNINAIIKDSGETPQSQRQQSQPATSSSSSPPPQETAVERQPDVAQQQQQPAAQAGESQES